MKKILFLILIVFCLDAISQNKEISVKSEVSEVTVFINGAQITRKKSVDVATGITTIKFTDLSPFLDSKSIHVKTDDGIMVLSVNQQFNYLDSAVRSNELKSLNGKIKVIQSKLDLENVNNDIINDDLSFLLDNRVIGGKNQELSLNNFKETSNFYHDKVSSLKFKQVEVKTNIENLQKEKGLLEKQVRQISSSKITPTSEVLVKISSKNLQKCNIELSYYVKNAGWFPTYDIRAKNIDEPIDLVYKANIFQNTKEDWTNVKLKLSSSNPNLGSIAPQLNTYFLNYNILPPSYNSSSNQASGRVIDIETNEPMIGVCVMVRGTTIGAVTNADGYFTLSVPNGKNEIAFSYIGYESQSQMISSNMKVYMKPEIAMLNEVVVVGYGVQKKTNLTGSISSIASDSKLSSFKSIAIPTEQTENQTSFEFEIKTPYTINSDNKNITVDIDNFQLDAGFEYYCVPKIDKDAFLIANIVNWEKYNLLEGEANIFFENTFVGKTILDVRNISDTLKLSLGRDKNIIVKREKIKDFTTKQFFGSKKEETRAWQISIKNNKKQAVSINLFDQIPVSVNSEIEVTSENISGGALEKESGEVKWNLKLEPGSKKELELKYKVKYPKERILTIE